MHLKWSEDVTTYILNNLEDFALTFLGPSVIKKSAIGLQINACPFCGHNGCFTLTRNFDKAHCFSCETKGSLINIVEQLYGEQAACERLAEWSNIPYIMPGDLMHREKPVSRRRKIHNDIT